MQLRVRRGVSVIVDEARTVMQRGGEERGSTGRREEGDLACITGGVSVTGAGTGMGLASTRDGACTVVAFRAFRAHTVHPRDRGVATALVFTYMIYHRRCNFYING